MNAFIITKITDEEYEALVTMYSSEAPLQYLSKIESELLNCNIKGCILIDQILHSGNYDERFIQVCLDEDGINKSSVKFIEIPKRSIFRKLSCDFLKSEDLVDTSILSSNQKKMIKKGMVI